MVKTGKVKSRDTLVDIRMAEGKLIIEGENTALVVDFDQNLITQVRPKPPYDDVPQERLISFHMLDHLSTIKGKSSTIKVDARKMTISAIY